VLAADGKTEWWTFGGNRANATLARQLARETASMVSHDSFTLSFDSAVKLQDVERAIVQLRQRDATDMRPAIDEAAIDGLKFSECLPTELAIEMLELRLQEPTATQHILKEDVRFLLR
jgi:ATP-dependent Lhr-like helicase